MGKGRAIATGIGTFLAVYDIDKKILLRTRMEKGSDIYDKDLSGKWELPGGGVELNDFEDSCGDAIVSTLTRELLEEAGLKLIELPRPIQMYPAWLKKDNIIDLAFVVPMFFRGDWVEITKSWSDLKEKNLIRFFSMEEVKKIEITSPRMRFLIETAFSVI